ncbi:MAG: hypothetical protein MHMPM18_001995 [Marteilia pararefringens]
MEGRRRAFITAALILQPRSLYRLPTVATSPGLEEKRMQWPPILDSEASLDLPHNMIKPQQKSFEAAARRMQLVKYLNQSSKSHLSQFEEQMRREAMKHGGSGSGADTTRAPCDYCDTTTIETTADLSHKWAQQLDSFSSNALESLTDDPLASNDYQICFERIESHTESSNSSSSEDKFANLFLPRLEVFDTKETTRVEDSNCPEISQTIENIIKKVWPEKNLNNHYSLPTHLPDGIIQMINKRDKYREDNFIYLVIMDPKLQREELGGDDGNCPQYQWLAMNEVLKSQKCRADSYWRSLKKILYQFID